MTRWDVSTSRGTSTTDPPGELAYTLLDPSGLRVSRLCLGTMTFGEEWGWGADKATSRAILTRFVEHGGNFIDTANNYTNGTSETWLGECIRGDRDRFVIGTKYSLRTRADDPNAGGNHRKSLVRSLEASLRRLRTDYVDIYWLHVWDALTPVDEILRALDDVVRCRQGVVRGNLGRPCLDRLVRQRGRGAPRLVVVHRPPSRVQPRAP